MSDLGYSSHCGINYTKAKKRHIYKATKISANPFFFKFGHLNTCCSHRKDITSKRLLVLKSQFVLEDVTGIHHLVPYSS